MKKDKVYLYTLLGLSIVVTAISLLTMNFLYQASKDRLLAAHLASGSRETREIARLLEEQLQNGIPEKQVINNLQRSIENTDTQDEFICMYNTSGMELCHPDPTHIGRYIGKGDEEQVSALGENRSTSFSHLLQTGQASGGIRSINARNRSEIIYVYPVKNTDWMVASHANLNNINAQLVALRNQFALTLALSALLICLSSFVIVRLIGRKYERNLEQEKDSLMEDVKQLSRLNADLLIYQQKIENTLPQNPDENDSGHREDTGKRRLLTYHKDQLVALDMENIAFFYTQQAQTLVYGLQGDIYPVNGSLDEMYKLLDKRLFFRANRQFLLSVTAIDKIFLYGKNQLKIGTRPNAPEDIIISKNKVAEFKNWLSAS